MGTSQSSQTLDGFVSILPFHDSGHWGACSSFSFLHPSSGASAHVVNASHQNHVKPVYNDHFLLSYVGELRRCDVPAHAMFTNYLGLTKSVVDYCGLLPWGLTFSCSNIHMIAGSWVAPSSTHVSFIKSLRSRSADHMAKGHTNLRFWDQHPP